MGSHNAFALGGHLVETGCHRRLQLVAAAPVTDTISESSPPSASLDVEVFNGRERGPTCWISAGIHGDELNGVEIARRLVQQLDPTTLRGTVLVLPVVNRSGFSFGMRTLADGSDLNRQFPGDAAGSGGERLADLLMREIVARCSHGLDLHTGSDGRDNLPQLHCRLDDPETAACARAFGAPVLLAAEARPGTLRAAAIQCGCKTLVYEGGGEGLLCEDAITTGLEGVRRWLDHLGIASRAPLAEDRPENDAFVPTRSCWIRSPVEGFLRLHADLGSSVESAATVGCIESRGGSNGAVELSSSMAGRVIGRSRRRYVRRGEPVLHVAARE